MGLYKEENRNIDKILKITEVNGPVKAFGKNKECDVICKNAFGHETKRTLLIIGLENEKELLNNYVTTDSCKLYLLNKKVVLSARMATGEDINRYECFVKDKENETKQMDRLSDLISDVSYSMNTEGSQIEVTKRDLDCLIWLKQSIRELRGY